MKKALLIIRARLVASEQFLRGGRRMMCDWSRLSAPEYWQETFSIFACCSATAQKQMACTFCNNFCFSRDEYCSLWRTNLSHAGELSLLHLDQDFALLGEKQQQWPNSRSHGPKAHALVLDTLSSSAHAKQKPSKSRWLQVSIDSVFAAPGANGVISKAGDRWEAVFFKTEPMQRWRSELQPSGWLRSWTTTHLTAGRCFVTTYLFSLQQSTNTYLVRNEWWSVMPIPYRHKVAGPGNLLLKMCVLGKTV